MHFNHGKRVGNGHLFSLAIAVATLHSIIAGRMLAAADWHEFRGGSKAGHATSDLLPETWSATDNVDWRIELPGQGWSSPVTNQGRIYLTAATPTDEPNSYELSVLCHSVVDGSIHWKTPIFHQGENSPKIHQKNSHASPTVVVTGKRLIVHFGHQGTACLDLSGKVIWRHQDVQYSPVHGNGGSPIVVDGKVIFSCDGARDPFVVALDIESGQPIWRTPRSVEADRKFSFSTPTIVRWKGQPQIISSGSNAVCAYSVDGNELWKVKYDGYSVIPKPVFANGLIYVCTGFNQPSLLAIRPGGNGDSTESHLAWSVKRQVPHTPSVLVIEDLLYMVSDRGVASCLVAESGEEVWQERLAGKGYSASPLFADGKIYFTSEDGITTVVRPGRQFTKVAENDLGERTLASLGVVDNSILIRTEAALYRITR